MALLQTKTSTCLKKTPALRAIYHLHNDDYLTRISKLLDEEASAVCRLNEVLLFPDNCGVFKKTFLTHFHHHDTQHLLQAMSIPDEIEISAISQSQ